MSIVIGNTTNSGSLSSSLSDLREGVDEALHLCAWMPGESHGEFGFDWYVVNLKTGGIRPTLSRMPPAARGCSSVVSCGNHIYVLGGKCSDDPTCPDGKIIDFHLHNDVFYFDREHPKNGWKSAAPMLVERMMPSAVVLKEKIYVFGGSALNPFAEVFDIRQNSWALLAAPPVTNVDPLSVSYPVLVDSRRSRILVHFACNCSLYAYYVDDKSWECLDENFGEWSSQSVIVEDVLYSFIQGIDDGTYFLSDRGCSLRAYDVVENKQLPIKWLSKHFIAVTEFVDLFHFGNGKLCFAMYNFDTLYTSQFSVSRNSGEICVIAESESLTATCTPFETSYCRLSLL